MSSHSLGSALGSFVRSGVELCGALFQPPPAWGPEEEAAKLAAARARPPPPPPDWDPDEEPPTPGKGEGEGKGNGGKGKGKGKGKGGKGKGKGKTPAVGPPATKLMVGNILHQKQGTTVLESGPPFALPAHALARMRPLNAIGTRVSHVPPPAPGVVQWQDVAVAARLLFDIIGDLPLGFVPWGGSPSWPDH